MYHDVRNIFHVLIIFQCLSFAALLLLQTRGRRTSNLLLAAFLVFRAAAEVGGVFFHFRARIVRLRVLAMLSVRLSTSAFLQYSSEGRSVSGNLRLRYNPREGVDFYLVYNETLNTDRFERFPVPPRSAGRAVMFKAGYTFDF